METYEIELDRVAADLAAGKPIEPTTIRAFLAWFGMYRRTRWNRDFIDRELTRRLLYTIPNYIETWVDAPMTFAIETSEQSAQVTSPNNTIKDEDVQVPQNNDIFGVDPAYKIGKLNTACRPPIFVSPNSSLAEVTTKMFANGFSQIPVMQNRFNVKGVVTWKSIGLRTAHGANGTMAKDFMEPASEVLSSASIFDVISIIADKDYVLVKDEKTNEITGIVTAADLCKQFEQISKPFLLISEVEINIRNMIENTFPASDLQNFFDGIAHSGDHKTEIRSEKLTFGHYIMILQNTDNWQKLGLKLDRKAFCEDLERIKDIRNDVMHFASEPVDPIDLEKIKSVARMLDMLRTISTEQ